MLMFTAWCKLSFQVYLVKGAVQKVKSVTFFMCSKTQAMSLILLTETWKPSLKGSSLIEAEGHITGQGHVQGQGHQTKGQNEGPAIEDQGQGPEKEIDIPDQGLVIEVDIGQIVDILDKGQGQKVDLNVGHLMTG